MATPSPVINGQAAAHEQPQRYGYDQSGPYMVRTWHGTRAAIAAQYAACLIDGATCEVTQGIGIDVLSARYGTSGGGDGGSEVVVDTWEFFANVIEKDSLEADISAVNAISEENKEKIIHHTDPTAEPVFTGGTASDALAEYRLRKMGAKSIRVLQPIVRHTQTVSSSYTIKASLTNVGKILTTAAFIRSEAMPADVLFNLPNDTPTDTTRYAFGWYKMHPTVRISAGQKIQIEQEWEYGLWAKLRYPDVIT